MFSKWIDVFSSVDYLIISQRQTDEEINNKQTEAWFKMIREDYFFIVTKASEHEINTDTEMCGVPATIREVALD